MTPWAYSPPGRCSAELAGVADVVESAASGLALIEDFAGYDRAIVIDAILTGRHPPGRIIEMALTDLGPVVAPSTAPGRHA